MSSRAFSTHSTALTMPTSFEQTSVVHALGVTASALAAPTVAAPGIETTVVEAPVVATFALEAPGIEAPMVAAPGIEATVIEAPGIEPTGVKAPVVDALASVPNPVLLTSLLVISVLPFQAPVTQSSVLDIRQTTGSLLPSSVSQPLSLGIPL